MIMRCTKIYNKNSFTTFTTIVSDINLTTATFRRLNTKNQPDMIEHNIPYKQRHENGTHHSNWIL